MTSGAKINMIIPILTVYQIISHYYARSVAHVELDYCPKSITGYTIFIYVLNINSSFCVKE